MTFSSKCAWQLHVHGTSNFALFPDMRALQTELQAKENKTNTRCYFYKALLYRALRSREYSEIHHILGVLHVAEPDLNLLPICYRNLTGEPCYRNPSSRRSICTQILHDNCAASCKLDRNLKLCCTLDAHRSCTLPAYGHGVFRIDS